MVLYLIMTYHNTAAYRNVPRIPCDALDNFESWHTLIKGPHAEVQGVKPNTLININS